MSWTAPTGTDICDHFTDKSITAGTGVEILDGGFDHIGSKVQVVVHQDTSRPTPDLNVQLDCSDTVNVAPDRIFGEVNWDGDATYAAVDGTDFTYLTQESAVGTFGVAIMSAASSGVCGDLSYVVYNIENLADFEEVGVTVGDEIVATYDFVCTMRQNNFGQSDWSGQGLAFTNDFSSTSSDLVSYEKTFTVTTTKTVNAEVIAAVTIEADSKDASVDEVITISEVVQIDITSSDGSAVPEIQEAVPIQIQFVMSDKDGSDGIVATDAYEVEEVTTLTFAISGGNTFNVIDSAVTDAANDYTDDANFIRLAQGITKDGDGNFESFFMLPASTFTASSQTVDITGAVKMALKSDRRRNVDENGVELDGGVSFQTTGIIRGTEDDSSASSLVAKSFALVAGAVAAFATMC